MRVRDLALKSVGLNRQTIGIDAAIQNPNPLSLLVNQLAMNFNFAGKDLGTASLSNPIELRAGDETSVGLDYSTNLMELLGSGLNDVQVSGTGGVDHKPLALKSHPSPPLSNWMKDCALFQILKG